MKKILFIAPHLSTGGLPQVLVNKLELLKDDYTIKCVEWSWHGDAFVVQKNRIKNLIGPQNLFMLGEDKDKIFDLIHNFQPDIICLEEFCEHFISEEINENAGDGDEKSLSDHLNKTASKDEKSFDSILEEKRTNKKLDKSIEEMLEDDSENWGHQFSDDDLKEFAQQLGLDYILEESREED
jgi:hypothetical protein